jgi:hypothetical protein
LRTRATLSVAFDSIVIVANCFSFAFSILLLCSLGYVAQDAAKR